MMLNIHTTTNFFHLHHISPFLSLSLPAQVELENWVNSIHSACAAAFARHRGKTGTLHLLQEEIFRLDKAIESVCIYVCVCVPAWLCINNFFPIPCFCFSCNLYKRLIWESCCWCWRWEKRRDKAATAKKSFFSCWCCCFSL